MSITAQATPNIALIKYWGNRNNDLRLPAGDSFSMTLDQPVVEITVDHSPTLVVDSYEMDGTLKILTEKHITRFQKHLDLTKKYLTKLGKAQAIPESVKLSIRSKIPPSIGLASSAAVFGCLAKAYSGLIEKEIALDLRQQSVIGRLGSGSAARSLYGGYAALWAKSGDEIDSSYSEQIADENHWNLHDIIIVPSHEEKKVGSTEGHATAWSSPHYEKRLEAIRTRRQQECIDAVLKHDFEKLQAVVEEDALDMHNVMMTSTPSLKYLTDETYRIMDEIDELKGNGLEVLYTMDAGPTVHLFCTDAARAQVVDYAKSQKNCTIFEAKVGPGACILL